MEEQMCLDLDTDPVMVVEVWQLKPKCNHLFRSVFTLEEMTDEWIEKFTYLPDRKWLKGKVKSLKSGKNIRFDLHGLKVKAYSEHSIATQVMRECFKAVARKPTAHMAKSKHDYHLIVNAYFTKRGASSKS